MRELSDQQRKVLSVIEQSIREHGYAPSIREIGRALKIKSPNAVSLHLIALERKGWITRRPTEARAIRVLASLTELERHREQLRAELARVESRLTEARHAAA